MKHAVYPGADRTVATASTSEPLKTSMSGFSSRRLSRELSSGHSKNSTSKQKAARVHANNPHPNIISSYIKKFETFHSSPDYPQVDSSLRGKSGPVQSAPSARELFATELTFVVAGYFGYVSKGTKKFIDACAQAGIPRAPDVNTHRGTMGVTKVSWNRCICYTSR